MLQLVASQMLQPEQKRQWKQDHPKSMSHNCRSTEGIRLEGTTVGQLVQPTCTWHRIASRFLNIFSEGDSTASLGNLFQRLVTCIVKKFFLISRWNLLCISFYLLPPVLLLGITEQSVAPSSDTLPSHTYMHRYLLQLQPVFMSSKSKQGIAVYPRVLIQEWS